MSWESEKLARPQVEVAASLSHARLQFSLRQLLVVMLALSIVLAIVFAFPDWVASAIYLVATVLVLPALATAVVYGRGDVRAFCIGALFPTGVLALIQSFGIGVFVLQFLVMSGTAPWPADVFETLARLAGVCRIGIIIGWPLAISAGILSVVLRRCFTWKQDEA
jgi:hypothetical protein